MNFHQLRIFDVAARHSSYSKAAKELFLSQPTVTIHLQKLEQALHIKLFEHLGQKLYLTEGGKLLFRYTQQMFPLEEEAHKALEELKCMRQGRIRIGVSLLPGIYYLPKFLEELRENYPGIEFTLDIASSRIIQKKLQENHLDFAILGDCYEIGEGLVHKTLWFDSVVAVMSAKHPLSGRNRVSLEDLIGQKLILAGLGSDIRNRIETLLRKRENHIHSDMEYESLDGIMYAVRANLGIGLVSAQAARPYIQAGLIVAKEITGTSLEVHYCIVYHKDKYRTQLTENIIQSIRKLIAQKWTEEFEGRVI